MKRRNTKENKKLVKEQREQAFTMRQEVVRSGVKGQSFDLILRFNNTATQPELFLDENTKLILEGLIERYGEILVKINCWDSSLVVIAPNEVPNSPFIDAPQGHSEGSGSTEESNPTPSSTQEK